MISSHGALILGPATRFWHQTKVKPISRRLASPHQATCTTTLNKPVPPNDRAWAHGTLELRIDRHDERARNDAAREGCSQTVNSVQSKKAIITPGVSRNQSATEVVHTKPELVPGRRVSFRICRPLHIKNTVRLSVSLETFLMRHCASHAAVATMDGLSILAKLFTLIPSPPVAPIFCVLPSTGYH
ncbi:hypothetical protein LY76DRAFT_10408 [Colletotrichum caudatum]|nr:hypothetical protein LY76DRAFT_10408 [Colletotrichum caudatum]